MRVSRSKKRYGILMFVGLMASPLHAEPFTFQGHLKDNGAAVTGSANLSFSIYAQPTGGTPLSPPVVQAGYPIADGVFTIDLDFAGVAFDGSARWLEVEADGQVLLPRLLIQPAPLASSANGLRGRSIDAMQPLPGEALLWDGSAWTPGPAGSSYQAGTGLVLSGTTFSLASTALIPQGCANGDYPAWNAAANAWQCQAGTAGTVSPGVGLTQNGAAIDIIYSYRLPQACSDDQVAKFNLASGGWICDDYLAAYSAGGGLALNANQFELLPAFQLPQGCGNGQVVESDGANGWLCAVDDTGSATPGVGLQDNAGALEIAASYRLPQQCSDGQIGRFDGPSGNWVCGDDQGQLYTAGTGLLDNTGTWEIAATYRLPQSCANGQLPTFDTASGLWICSARFEAGTGLAIDAPNHRYELRSSYRLPQSCAAGEVAKNDGSGNWLCDDDDVASLTPGLGLQSNAGALELVESFRLPQTCVGDQVAKLDGVSGDWVCADYAYITYAAGLGLDLTGNQFSLLPAYQLPQSCSNGQVPKTNASGQWTCADDLNGNATPGIGLEDSGGALDIVASYRLPQACAGDQVAKFDGFHNVWICADDSGNAYTAGTGLLLTGNRFDLASEYRLPLSCAAGQVAKYDGLGGWSCAADANGAASVGIGLQDNAGTLEVADSFRLPQACLSGQIASFNGSQWDCDYDYDSQRGAGTGLALSGNDLMIAPYYQLPQSCAVDQIAKFSVAGWYCADDLGAGSGAYTAGDGLTLNGGTFAADFDGSGSAVTVARSDHGHFGSRWIGNSTASGFDPLRGVLLQDYGVGTALEVSSNNPAATNARTLLTTSNGQSATALFASVTAGDAGSAAIRANANGSSTAIHASSIGGTAIDASGLQFGVKAASDNVAISAETSMPGGFGMLSANYASSGNAYAIVGMTFSPEGIAVEGIAQSSAAGFSAGLRGTAVAPSGYGVVARNNATSGTATALLATTGADGGTAAEVIANGGAGARALLATSQGTSSTSNAVQARLGSPTSSGSALYATANSASARAGEFHNFASGNRVTLGNGGTALEAAGNVIVAGDLGVFGNVSKAGGSFKIDHPLDPENKYLYHSFVESPEMMNIYNGNVITDAAGFAKVTLPEWFDALNRDFRYQLTVIGSFAQAIIAEEIVDNHFQIQTSHPGVKVSWMVTGVRRDPWAEKHRIPVEADKDEAEQGRYLHPELYGESMEKRIGYTQAKPEEH